MKAILSRAHQLLHVIEVWAAFVAGLLVLLIMGLGVWEVAGRGFFAHPLHGYLDMVEQLMVPVALLGLPYCQAELGNVRMTLLVGQMTGRPRWIIEAVAFLIGLGVIVVLIKGSWLHFLRAYSIGGSTAEIQLQIWVTSLSIPFVLAVLALRLLLQLLETIRLIVSPIDDTVIIDYRDHASRVLDDNVIDTPKGVE